MLESMGLCPNFLLKDGSKARQSNDEWMSYSLPLDKLIILV